jgi:hypothetical protein
MPGHGRDNNLETLVDYMLFPCYTLPAWDVVPFVLE